MLILDLLHSGFVTLLERIKSRLCGLDGHNGN